MIDAFALAQKLGGVSFATLLVFILIGSYYRIWVWGSVVTELRADFEQRILKYEASSERWQAMALRATGLAETSVDIAKKTSGNGG